jgi:hypothetical protein
MWRPERLTDLQTRSYLWADRQGAHIRDSPMRNVWYVDSQANLLTHDDVLILQPQVETMCRYRQANVRRWRWCGLASATAVAVLGLDVIRSGLSPQAIAALALSVTVGGLFTKHFQELGHAREKHFSNAWESALLKIVQRRDQLLREPPRLFSGVQTRGSAVEERGDENTG